MGQQFDRGHPAHHEAGAVVTRSIRHAAPSRREPCSSRIPPATPPYQSTTQVTLTVSSSQSSVQVPNVVGFSQTSAGSTITSANLTVGTQTHSVFASRLPPATSRRRARRPERRSRRTHRSTWSSRPGPVRPPCPHVVGDTAERGEHRISNTPGLTPAFTQVDCSSERGHARPGAKPEPLGRNRAQPARSPRPSPCPCARRPRPRPPPRRPEEGRPRRRPLHAQYEIDDLDDTSKDDPADLGRQNVLSPRSGGGCHPRQLRQEVAQKGGARDGQDRFRVELDAFDGQLTMAQPHDHAVGRGGGHHQLLGYRVRVDDERVVAGGHEGVR